ncbi:PadR family transcriptional regulator [Devosia sediminis]|uniref:PadR family transcriptional regulator n=1 Tax=Devosia sediminis TaxID=2798801 RepID=A0A934MKK3_9HYPH|nr:PadR family transcriptional regulator [Devosia sediminis]MBJ3785238.1 PadR family transcriptional regulator [Devosia sediminis]
MNVRTLCLSILYDGEASGYDIRRMCTEGNFAYFVEASYGSIYPALSRLEDDGLVTSRTEQQDGKPARKVYTITAAGRAAFAEELSGPLGEDMFRSPFLLFARFAHILPRELVEARCNEFLERSVEGRKQLEQAPNEHACNAADLWVINYGRAVLEVAEKHFRTHMHELITMARAEPHKDAAE